jgi:hypothetical protein
MSSKGSNSKSLYIQKDLQTIRKSFKKRVILLMTSTILAEIVLAIIFFNISTSLSTLETILILLSIPLLFIILFVVGIFYGRFPLSLKLDNSFLTFETTTLGGKRKTRQFQRDEITADLDDYHNRYSGRVYVLILKCQGKTISIDNQSPGWNTHDLKKIYIALNPQYKNLVWP